MDEPRQGTAHYTVSVCATATVTGDFHSVHDLEQAILEATRAAARRLYAQDFVALQHRWLAAHRHRFSAQRWSTLRCLTPFGPVGLPVRAVRKKPSGRYLTLSKAFLRHKATRLLSPALEQEACAAATEQNYRPTACALSRWISARLGPWLLWACVQFHGARLLLEQEKAPPPPPRPMNAPAPITEVDFTWLKARQRRRQGPVRHFPVHLDLHYTGRQRPRSRPAPARWRKTSKSRSTAASNARAAVGIPIAPNGCSHSNNSWPGPQPGTPGGKPNPNSTSNPTRLDLPSPTDN